MTFELTAWSTSRAQDAGYLALADVSGLASELGADYRVVGGQMVSLLVDTFCVTAAPARETADADFAAAAPVVADERLLRELTRRGYAMAAGNRFVRTVGRRDRSTGTAVAPHAPVSATNDEDPLELTIDVLVPSYSGRHQPNQPVGDLTVDAVPGSVPCPRTTARHLTVTARLRDPEPADAANVSTTFSVLVPGPLSALAVKALAWASRHSPRDAVDVWRLLEVASAAGMTPTDWSDTGRARRRPTGTRASFGRRQAGGTTHATTDAATRLRIAALVQQHVGRPAT